MFHNISAIVQIFIETNFSPYLLLTQAMQKIWTLQALRCSGLAKKKVVTKLSRMHDKKTSYLAHHSSGILKYSIITMS